MKKANRVARDSCEKVGNVGFRGNIEKQKQFAKWAIVYQCIICAMGLDWSPSYFSSKKKLIYASLTLLHFGPTDIEPYFRMSTTISRDSRANKLKIKH